MNRCSSFASQRGITLVVSLIMMLLITLLVTTALTLSTSNLSAVGNMQLRGEALTAAQNTIHRIESAAFALSPGSYATTFNEDIDNDGVTDYLVTTLAPVCIRSSVATAPVYSSVTLGSTMISPSTYNTVWDIDATATDISSGTTGASVHVHSGLRVLLTQAQKDATCP